MNTFKNAVIALLAGLLVLTLSTQNSNGAGTSYDAVKLANYAACINAHMNWDIATMQAMGGNGDLHMLSNIQNCNSYRP